MKQVKLTLLFFIMIVASIYSIPAQAKNKTTYRALAIGQTAYPISKQLPGSKNDAKAMTRVLKKTGYSKVETAFNVSKELFQEWINYTFANADSNDVSLLYYSGHGVQYNEDAGSLVTIEETTEDYISPAELASWLKKIPGTIVVILDSCGSGAVINRSVTDDTFNNRIIKAFSDSDITARSGELRKSKFKVLTACSKGHLSYETDGRGVFTERLINGLGFKYASGAKKSKAPADTNKNKSITLAECWNYIKHLPRPYTPTSKYPQSPQCYPTNCKLTIFKR